MDSKPIIAGFLISAGASAFGGCGADAGQSANTEAVGEVQQKLSCGQDVEICDDCSTEECGEPYPEGTQQCTNFHPFSQCDVTSTGSTCGCYVRLESYYRECIPQCGGGSGGGDDDPWDPGGGY
jgi:hypothetical protein